MAIRSVVIIRFDGDLLHFAAEQNSHQSMTGFVIGDEFRHGVKQLLVAQAHIPPTELVEVAGFNGTRGMLGPRFDQFDDGKGGIVPPPDGSTFRNEPIRQAILGRLNGNAKYRKLFGQLFPPVAAGGLIDFIMFGRAVAEFEFTQIYANAPVDRFARGNEDAMEDSQKRGALVFFGKGR